MNRSPSPAGPHSSSRAAPAEWARAARRLWWVDLLKALAAPLIVLHHAALYGPLSDGAAVLAPALFEWLVDHGRLAVQVFLVVGGFLAARQLAPGGRLRPGLRPLGLVATRWRRLLPAYAAMLALALLCAGLARQWMEHDATPAAPTLAQVLTHLLMLQDLLAQPALSAGVWYLAIDLQCFALLALLLAAAQATERKARLRRGARGLLGPWTVALVALASALWFNLQAGWDVAAPYFFAAYGLGALAAWRPCAPKPWRWVALVALAAAAALVVEARERLLLALAVAALLAAVGHRAAPAAVPAWLQRWVAQGARLSYALFLVHYPVSLVVNAAFDRWLPAQPVVQMMGIALSLAASVVVAWGFHLLIEQPAARRFNLGARQPLGLR